MDENIFHRPVTDFWACLPQPFGTRFPPENPVPAASPRETDAYLARVQQILKQFDELPRLAPAQSADEIIGSTSGAFPQNDRRLLRPRGDPDIRTRARTVPQSHVESAESEKIRKGDSRASGGAGLNRL